MARFLVQGLSRPGAPWLLLLPLSCALAAAAQPSVPDGAAALPLPPLGTAGRVNVAPGAAAGNQPQLDFDIPAQPLAAALSRYAFLARQPALYASDLAAGRSSSAVEGRYAPEAALERLLMGTGLVAEKVHTGAGDTFVLTEEFPGAQAGTAPRRDGKGSAPPDEGRPYAGWAGQIQARIWQALCADARTVPGSYGSLLRFSLDAQGRVHDARLLDPSGDSRRDAALLSALHHVRLDAAPPAALVGEPFTMAVLPLGAGSTGSPCRTETRGG